jgi:broad specificity phosphatase PhoE
VLYSGRKLFVVRHGQSEWNGKKRISGQLDPPLSEKGRHQAQALARALQEESLGAVYSSSLSRAVETARPVAEFHNLPITTCDALKEIHLGILQGRYRDERDPEAQELWAKRTQNKRDFRVAGGETFAELEQRVRSCLNEILLKGAQEALLIVGHRSTNRVLLSSLMNWSEQTAISLNLRSKLLYEIVLGATPQLFTIQPAAGTKYFGFRG